MQDAEGFYVNATCNGCLSSGRWTLLTFVKLGNDMKIYIDGKQQKTRKSNRRVNSRPFRGFFEPLVLSLRVFFRPAFRQRDDPAVLHVRAAHFRQPGRHPVGLAPRLREEPTVHVAYMDYRPP